MESSIRQAAVLTAHWQARDVEAVTLLLSDVRGEEAQDLVLALLMLRDVPLEQVQRIIRSR